MLLNNELDDFAAKPGAANVYGLVGGDANAPGPMKRPLSSMSPTLVFKDGKLVMATGSPGGSRIITIVVQIIVNVIDHGLNVAEARERAARPRPALARRVARRARGIARHDPPARGMGHKVVLSPSMGSANTICRAPDGELRGASDCVSGMAVGSGGPIEQLDDSFSGLNGSRPRRSRVCRR